MGPAARLGVGGAVQPHPRAAAAQGAALCGLLRYAYFRPHGRMLAAQNGQLEALRVLVELGADTTLTSRRRGADSFRDMAENRGQMRVVRWLERSMAWTPLHHACDARAGPARVCALLRSDGADPRQPSALGETLLQVAVLSDPSQGALPECAATTAIIRQALLPWVPERHMLFPRSFNRVVMALLLLGGRLAPSVPWEVWLDKVAPRLQCADL